MSIGTDVVFFAVTRLDEVTLVFCIGQFLTF